MLVRHGLIYAAGRGLPGLINFASLAVFTRLLSPEQFGEYTLVVTAVGTADALLLQWLRLALLRFLPRADVDQTRTLSTIIRIMLTVVGVVGLVGALVASLVIRDETLEQLVYLGIVLFVVQGVFEITLEWVRSSLAPMRYGLYAGIKAVMTLLVGAGLAIAGWGAQGLLFGLIVSMSFALVVLGAPRAWAQAIRGPYDASLAGAIVRYGLPLATTATLGFIVATSDRFMLAAFLDRGVAGTYAVGYDLANYGIGMLLSIVNLAAYPLVVTTLENQGAAAARNELEKTLSLLLLFGLPAAVGMAVLAPNIAAVMVGQDFRTATEAVLPWIALAALIAGVKSYYLDLAFQLGHDTIKQLWIMLVTVVLNVVLNVLWIPVLGLQGAIYSTVLAYGVAALMAWWFGRSSFKLPLRTRFISRSIGSIVLASVAMAGALYLTRRWVGGPELVVQVLIGGLVYVVVVIAMNRTHVLALLRRKI